MTHKIDYMDYLNTEREGNGEGVDYEFVLVGHSIGSYVCIEAMKRRVDLNIEHCIGTWGAHQNT